MIKSFIGLILGTIIGFIIYLGMCIIDHENT